MQPENTVQWWQDEVKSRPFTVAVVYRGVWCPWCSGYLKELNKDFVDNVRKAGGELFAVSAQHLDDAKAAKTNWGLKYDVVADPSTALARHFGVFITPKEATHFASHPTMYPNGLSQPALIAVAHDGTKLFEWIINPSEMNLGGASDRPLPEDVWSAIEKKLAAPSTDTAPATAAGLQLLDFNWLLKNYPEEYNLIAGWLKGQQAEGKFKSAPVPPV